jgi:hypothetical protein
MCSVDIGLHRWLYMQSWCHSLSNDFAKISCKAKACSRIGSMWRCCFKKEVIRLCLCVDHKYYTLLQTITVLLIRDACWSLVLLGCSRQVDGKCMASGCQAVMIFVGCGKLHLWVPELLVYLDLEWFDMFIKVFSYCLWCCNVCSLKVLISVDKVPVLIRWL